MYLRFITFKRAYTDIHKQNNKREKKAKNIKIEINKDKKKQYRIYFIRKLICHQKMIELYQKLEQHIMDI